MDMDVMVAFAFEDYGQKTNSRFSTYFEVKYACENMKPIIPLKLYEGPWPPQPADDKEGCAQNRFAFNPSLVYESYSAPFDETKLAQIAEYILKHPGKGHGRALNADKASSKPAKSAADELAELPMAVPQLPRNISARPEIIEAVRSALLNAQSSNKVLAYGPGGVGKTIIAGNKQRNPPGVGNIIILCSHGLFGSFGPRSV